jgi:outer membrane protein OmpA-like peptidoglycan-associated protein
MQQKEESSIMTGLDLSGYFMPSRERLRGGVVGLAALALTVTASGAMAGEANKLLTEIHFDPGSAEVTIGGQQKIAKVIAAIKKQNPREILIRGFTDTTGDEVLNRAISLDRADNVANLLADNGITLPMIIEGKGEDGAPYDTPDDVSEPLNRCVGIVAVGKAEKQPPL